MQSKGLNNQPLAVFVCFFKFSERNIIVLESNGKTQYNKNSAESFRFYRLSHHFKPFLYNLSHIGIIHKRCNLV